MDIIKELDGLGYKIVVEHTGDFGTTDTLLVFHSLDRHKCAELLEDMKNAVRIGIKIDEKETNVFYINFEDITRQWQKRIKHDLIYLDMCELVGKFSYCERKKVGCILVKDRQIISHGYNGTLPGACNCCEDENGDTLSEVVHAEKNAVAKLAKHGNSGDGAVSYTNLSPCTECTTLLVSAGVKRIVYDRLHSSTKDLDLLNELDVYCMYYNKNIDHGRLNEIRDSTI